MAAAIVTSGVGKSYGDGAKALNAVSLTVNQGEIFGFLGPNGAGKTTMIKILLGLITPSCGRVEVLGRDPREPASRRRIGYLPEVANYYGFMNVVELLRFYGTLCGLPRHAMRERIDEMLELVGLTDVRQRSLRKFSKGMLQRAGIAQALLHDPDLLILDEPVTGLDPLGRRQIRDVILSMRERAKTVFFSSHELSEAEMICDRVGILCQGELSWCGPTREVAGDGDANLERVFLRIIAPGDGPDEV